MKTDKNLQLDVIDELAWDPSIDASQIGVASKNGVVTLTGSVGSYLNKLEAERICKRVIGVKAVANDIEVNIPGMHTRNDTDIAGAALSALKWDASVPHEKLKVVVNNGWITLEGSVNWYFQRNAAENCVKTLEGVKGVFNHIAVVSATQSKDIKKKIKSALHRTAEYDANSIMVDANESTVTLSGKVRSFTEKEEAESAAWRAPGVTQVKNEIQVGY